MQRKGVLSISVLLLGIVMLAVAGMAPAASSARKGGTLRIDSPEDVDYIDPGLAYGTTSWEIEYVTALKLLDYPDAGVPRGSRLVPSGASHYTVSKDGKTYTFFVRHGFRFSNDERVTAKNYAYAINRNLDRALQSPAFQFVSDPQATNIVGAAAVRAGSARNASGVVAKGNRLIVKLTKADPTFLAKVTMPFFQATSTKLARGKEVVNVNDRNDLPTAGPYYVATRDPNRTIILKRNPFYRGPRPHNASVVTFKIGINLEAAYREVLAGDADYSLGLPPTVYAELAQRYGVNKGRFQVKPTNCTSYLALNNDNPLFRNNVALRKAVNYAIDRTAMTQQYGAFAGSPTDQLLPPTFPGFRQATIYPNRPNLTRARQLARGKTRSGKAVYFYTRRAPAPQIMEINRANLARIGIEIQPKQFAGFDIFDAMGKRGSEHAIGQAGWCQDYPDPYDFVNVLLYGGAIQAENNNNVAYFNNRAYNRRLEQAAKLLGNKRMQTYGRLDIDIARTMAPLANWRNPNVRLLFSNRVDMKTFVYQGVYEAPDYAVLALK
jgi:ABC-type oligopeptide transport system substrate-binding subunit